MPTLTPGGLESASCTPSPTVSSTHTPQPGAKLSAAINVLLQVYLKPT